MVEPAPPAGRRTDRRWLAALLLVNVVVYAPSLFHVARGDQIQYLANVGHGRGLLELTLGQADYDRTREFNPGDAALYRPVQFILLGAERWAWGYRFPLWQATGLALHLLLAWRLFELLWALRPGIAAPLVALLFSVFHASAEMVVWHHLHGYLLFALLLVLCLDRMVAHAREGQASRRNLYILSGLCLLAAFTHELGSGVALAVAAYLVRSHPGPKRLSGLLPAAAPLVYAAVSLADYWTTPPAAPVPGPPAPGEPQDYGELLLFTNAWWLTAGLFPMLTRTAVGIKTLMLPPWTPVNFLLGPAAAAALAWIGWAGRGSGREPRLLRGCAFVAFLVLLGHEALIIVGRLAARGPEGLLLHSYYTHFFWLTLLIGTYALAATRPAWGVRWSRGAAGVLVAAAAVNAWLTFGLNQEIRRWSEPRAALVSRLEELRRRPGVTFAVDADYPGNDELPDMRRAGDPPGKVYHLAEALYLPWYDQKSPLVRIQARP